MSLLTYICLVQDESHLTGLFLSIQCRGGSENHSRYRCPDGKSDGYHTRLLRRLSIPRHLCVLYLFSDHTRGIRKSLRSCFTFSSWEKNKIFFFSFADFICYHGTNDKYYFTVYLKEVLRKCANGWYMTDPVQNIP